MAEWMNHDWAKDENQRKPEYADTALFDELRDGIPFGDDRDIGFLAEYIERVANRASMLPHKLEDAERRSLRAELISEVADAVISAFTGLKSGG
jgi:hypothetical protein